jgi:hypothetical protein
MGNYQTAFVNFWVYYLVPVPYMLMCSPSNDFCTAISLAACRSPPATAHACPGGSIARRATCAVPMSTQTSTSALAYPNDTSIHGLTDMPLRLLSAGIGCGTSTPRSLTTHTRRPNPKLGKNRLTPVGVAGAQCVGSDDVLRFTCRFGGWKNHTRQLDPPVGLPPSTRGRSTASNEKRRIGRYRLFTIYDFYFQLVKLAAYRPGPRAAPPSHPTAMGGAHAAIFRPRGGFAKQKLYKN